MVSDPRVQLVSKPPSPRTGIGRYTVELERGLRLRDVDLRVARLRNPTVRPIASAGKRLGYDLGSFFESYPIRVEARSGYVTHLTSQTLGALLLTQRLPRPVVVTVHDILPYLLRNSTLNVYRNRAQQLMDALAMRGLKRADRLIADSHYTKSTLVETLRIDPATVDVVHLGIDSERFRPQAVLESFCSQYQLATGRPYVLYVGSEDPRKNVPVLLKALKVVRETLPEATLLKIGAAAFADQRQRHLQLCEELGLNHAVRWFDDVPEEDLPLFYSASTVFGFPSLHEGFGFPVLESLACGTPVVAANSSSIPELVGDAATLIDGSSVESFAAELIRIMTSPRVSPQSIVAQATSFSWTQTLNQTLASYAKTVASTEYELNDASRRPSFVSRKADR